MGGDLRLSKLSIGFQAGELTADNVARMEDLPIDSLWVGGHVASRNPTPEAMVLLSRLSALSKRVKIGTAILLLPLYSPAIVAKQIADLDRYTDGRLLIGIGIGGEYPQEFRACGVPLTGRGRRTDEMVELMRKMWTAEEIEHHGEFFDMTEVKIHPAPVQEGGPPIIVAGRQESAMKRAVKLGDGWMPYLYSARRFGESVATINALAAEAGRDLTGFGWYAFLFVNVNADRDVAIRQTATQLGGQYKQDFEQMVSRVAVAGNPDDVRATLQEFVDAGARHFIFTPCGHPDPSVLQRQLVEEIIPSLEV
jgi:probable F420-dependent oxidoreductase